MLGANMLLYLQKTRQLFHLSCNFLTGMCARCSKPVRGQFNGLAAMDKVYHVTCFSCCGCGE